MATVPEIFNSLVEAKHIQVQTGSQSAHDSLRIRLVKMYSRHKDLLESLGVDDGTSILSVSGSFDVATGTSTFHIRKRMNGAKLEFMIVEADPYARAYCDACGYVESHDPNCPKPKDG